LGVLAVSKQGAEKRTQQFINDEVIRLRSDVNNLIGWQKSQNGYMKSVNQKVDRLLYWFMGMTAGIAVQLFYLFMGGL